PTDREGRTRRVDPRSFDRTVHELARGHDLVDDTGGEGILRRERRTAKHHVECLLPTDEPRQPLRPAGAREQPERHLRKADPVAAFGGDAEVAAQCDLETAAEAVAIDRRNDDLRRLLELADRLVRADDEGVLRERSEEHT